jgi:hypothetical protein
VWQSFPLGLLNAAQVNDLGNFGDFGNDHPEMQSAAWFSK